ncbi:cytochrome c [Novosphingobium sp. ZN18A2]|uniref:c-type cytochrome n=1 Tax=Novosphingobium sp. ZN18A2 TaxID=3079861 RepID=UPI0030D57B87
MKTIATLSLAIAALTAGGAALARKPVDPTAKARADFPVYAAEAKSPDEAEFLARCGYCHLKMGFGTLSLMKTRGPDKALLANRTDLDGGYIRAVVRNGIMGMPAITRAEVSDGELDSIVHYLTRNNPKK